jgi:hypothetical protein
MFQWQEGGKTYLRTVYLVRKLKCKGVTKSPKNQDRIKHHSKTTVPMGSRA